MAAVSVLLAGVLAVPAPAQTGLSLHDAIAEAETSPVARQGRDRVNEAEGLLRQAGLRPNPHLFLTADDLRPWDSHNDFPNQTEDYAYLSQIFELGGKRRSRVGLAQAQAQQTKAEQDLLNAQIAAGVAKAYWTVLATAGVARLLADDMQAVDGIVRYNRERVDAGAMRGVDLLRVQIERDRLDLALSAARRDAELARVELFRQIGCPADSQTALTGTLDSTPRLPDKSLPEVLNTRADVIVARDAVAAAEADVKLQRSLAVPDLDLQGGYKRNIGSNTIYSLLQIPLPIFNRNQGEIARAGASVTLAQDRLRALEITVRAEMDAARKAYAEQQRMVRDVLPDMRSRARQNLDIMNDAYRTGGVDLLRLLDAQRTEFEVEVSALQTLAEFQQAALRLQLANGVLP